MREREKGRGRVRERERGEGSVSIVRRRVDVSPDISHVCSCEECSALLPLQRCLQQLSHAVLGIRCVVIAVHCQTNVVSNHLL